MKIGKQCTGCRKMLDGDGAVGASGFRRVPLLREKRYSQEGLPFILCDRCNHIAFSYLEEIYQDMAAEFAPFAERYMARRGKVPTEEIAALYEDFHGVKLKREKGNE